METDKPTIADAIKAKTATPANPANPANPGAGTQQEPPKKTIEELLKEPMSKEDAAKAHASNAVRRNYLLTQRVAKVEELSQIDLAIANIDTDDAIIDRRVLNQVG